MNNLFSKILFIRAVIALLVFGMFVALTSCDKEAEDPIDTRPLERVETSIEFASVLPGKEKNQLSGTQLKLTLNGKDVTVSGLKADKLISGYIYKYKITKPGYVTAEGSVRAMPKVVYDTVAMDTLSVKLTPYNVKTAKLTIVPVSDSKGTAKSGAKAVALEAGKAKKLDPNVHTGYYKLIINVNNVDVRDSVINLVDKVQSITMAGGYYITANTIPDVGGVDNVVKKGGSTPLTAESDGRYFVSYKDTGMYVITKDKGVNYAKVENTAHVKTADVTTSLYLYTDLDVNLYNPVHSGDAAAFDFEYIRVKNMEGETLKGESAVAKDLDALGGGLSLKVEKLAVDTAKGGYYKFLFKGLAGQLPDSTIIKVSKDEGYKKIKLEVRPIIDLQLATVSTTDSVSIKSVKYINGSVEEEYKTNAKLGVEIPTEFKNGDKKTTFAEATLTAKIPSLPLDNNEAYYVLQATVKSGDSTKDVSLKITLKSDGDVAFYGNDNLQFPNSEVTLTNKKVTFDYTKL